MLHPIYYLLFILLAFPTMCSLSQKLTSFISSVFYAAMNQNCSILLKKYLLSLLWQAFLRYSRSTFYFLCLQHSTYLPLLNSQNSICYLQMQAHSPQIYFSGTHLIIVIILKEAGYARVGWLDQDNDEPDFSQRLCVSEWRLTNIIKNNNLEPVHTQLMMTLLLPKTSLGHFAYYKLLFQTESFAFYPKVVLVKGTVTTQPVSFEDDNTAAEASLLC